MWSEAILEEVHRHEQVKLADRGSAEAVALQEADRLLAPVRGNFDDDVDPERAVRAIWGISAPPGQTQGPKGRQHPGCTPCGRRTGRVSG